MDFTYRELITEVQTTNDLLETQNDIITDFKTPFTIICILLLVVILRDVF